MDVDYRHERGQGITHSSGGTPDGEEITGGRIISAELEETDDDELHQVLIEECRAEE